MKMSLCGVESLLQLSKNEQVIYRIFRGRETPVSLSKKCSIPRPTIYITLTKLLDRGLLRRRKYGHKIYWQKSSDEHLESILPSLEKFLMQSAESSQEKIIVTDAAQIVVHKGRKALVDVFTKLIHEHAGERMLAIQGDLAGGQWDEALGLKNINRINDQIKRSGIITEMVTSKGWFATQLGLYGIDWAKSFMGRPIRAQNIESQYLDYASQIFVFKDRVLLVSMSERVFVEIKNSQIAMLIISLIRFVQDHSGVIDANALLQGLIGKKLS
jgi:predicted transcriptional regulator